jgi:tetratricopeptide (TPR) repeat protein
MERTPAEPELGGTAMRRPAVCVFLVLVATGLVAAGPDGPKPDTRSSYPFAVPPPKTFAVLDRLGKPGVTRDERSLFADAADGKLDDWSFAEACLLASGVTDPGKRKDYLKRIDELEAGARKALDGAATTAEKGEKLLTFLHAGPMAKGYQSEQTLLHTVLDDGKFNCVSSAVLYTVLGKRLGLELRAVELPGTEFAPGHVFAVVLDGQDRLDVETTNKLGFNPKRDEATLKKLQKPGDEVYDPKKHKGKVREVGDLGLVAIIYYNRGVLLAKQKKHHEGVLACFSALCLDPDSPSAVNNATAGLANWGKALTEGGKYEQALDVLAAGLAIAPGEDIFRTNTIAAYDAWAKSRADKEDWAGAVGVYEKGLVQFPGDKHLAGNAKVYWYRRAEYLLADGKDDAAVAACRQAAAALPREKAHFLEAEADLYRQAGSKLAKAGNWPEAIALAEQGMGKVGERPQELLRNYRNGLYLNWSNAHAEKKEFEKALKVLQKGMTADPKEKRFRNNVVAVYDAWADTFMKKKDWAGAIGVYQKGLAQFPGDKHLENNLKYCEQEQKKKK